MYVGDESHFMIKSSSVVNESKKYMDQVCVITYYLNTGVKYANISELKIRGYVFSVPL
jgi:hypothetical protein